uniref:RING-type E3 ubiquitin transferase n=1 Tax=Cajanus cajan TaxID=3821 RepID=A0A151U137_CAJCA|nr:U-box domain-containing protein 2 [Cajanus cajan]
MKSEPVSKYYQKAEKTLKLLKPIIDTTIFSDLASNEVLGKLFEKLGVAVDELKELIMSWHPLSSKFYFVIQVDPLVSIIQTLGLGTLQQLSASPECLPDNLGNEKSSTIKEAIMEQLEGVGQSLEVLENIAENLGLRSNQEVLIEVVALEKLKENAEQIENTAEAEYIDQMISVVYRMHEHLVTLKQAQNSIQVKVPADFCCPLSLELMTDPVIVASGQTYERAFIKNWIDLGLNVCPKTRQTLVHTNLIPNYTVKALIANWCELNDVKPIDPIKSKNINLPSPSHGSMESGLVKDSSVITSGPDAVAMPTRHREPEFSPQLAVPRSQSHTVWQRSSEWFVPRIVSTPLETRADLSATETLVQELVEQLRSDSLDAKREATAELRLLAKHNMDNRIVISNCGAISLLIDLLESADTTVQENCVTALLNLSINDNNKAAIANAGAIEPLIHVLKTGSSEAKENSAATLFSLSVTEENKIRIGRSGAIEPLVELLGTGTPRGKKDAATALFNLSISHENKDRIVQAGAVKHLVELMDPAAGMVDKAVAVLANLATIAQGKTEIGQQGGIPVLVEVIELGSTRGKENAAAALLHLCSDNHRYLNTVLQEGAVPPLVALSQSGTPRAKEKALALLNQFRSQRHGRAGRG